MRVGILGGSFDPIHNAHLIVAQLACEQLNLTEVRLVVSGQQPLKASHGASAVDRLQMVELAVAGIDGLVSDGRELLREGPSYTVDTLRELAAELPEAELVVLLGADAAAELPRWKDLAEVERLATIALFSRGGATPDAGNVQVEVPHLEISSTHVRSRAMAGKSLQGWVPGRVADYICGLALYRTQGGAG